MLTLFSTPRPFVGVFDVLQQNAIKSWLALNTKLQIILIEDELKTTHEIAKKYGLDYIPNIQQNEFGSLYLNDVFEKVRAIAKGNILAHVNTDIILFQDFIDIINGIPYEKFYLAGQRYNLDIEGEINFIPGWQSALLEDLHHRGKLHPPTGMDYWVFPKSWDFKMPPFIVGRPAVDNWFIQNALAHKIPVIDGTAAIKIIHQNHPRRYGDPTYEVEHQYNRRLAKGPLLRDLGPNYDYRLTDTTHRISADKLVIRKHFLYSLPSIIRSRDDLNRLPGPKLMWNIFWKIFNKARKLIK